MRVAIALLITVGILLGTVAAAIIGIGFYLSPQDDLRKADAIVAVSGGETKQRTAEAVKLYKQGYAKTLVFSGAAADSKGPSNAAAMRSDAVAAGVPSKAIIIEEDSASTLENALRTAPIIKDLGAESIILVTSPYHQRRASLNFRQILGPKVVIINHSATDSAWRKSSWWHQPSTAGLTFAELQKTAYAWVFKPSQ